MPNFVRIPGLFLGFYNINLVNLNFEFLLVEKNTEDPVKGCLESHITCIKDAINNDYENILIMEDDISFDIPVIYR